MSLQNPVVSLNDTYRYVPQVPLRDSDEALRVNGCELTTTTETGAVVYTHAWATSHPMTDDTVAPLVAAGRSRWKMENENNNVLKTKGYHFEHNYSHGKQQLSAPRESRAPSQDAEASIFPSRQGEPE